MDEWGTDFHEASCMRRIALDVTTSPLWWLKFQRMTVGATKQVATCEGRNKHGRSEKLKREQERLKNGSEENSRELEGEPVKSLREKLKKK